MNRTRPGKRLRTAVLPALLCVSLISGCVTTGANLNPLQTLAPAPRALTELPAPDDRQWADAVEDVQNQQARGFGLVNAPYLETYLNRLYARLKKAAGTPDWPGNVYLLASSSLDAYATAAGNIYISLPWVMSAESEDELLALLAHEFGHIYQHYHVLESSLSSTDAVALLAMFALALAKHSQLGSAWSKLDTVAVAYSASRQTGVGLYSRSQETAADQFALALTTRLNVSFDSGVKTLLERLLTWEEKNEARLAAQEKELKEGITQAMLIKHQERARGAGPASQAMAAHTAALDAAGAQLSHNLNQGVESFLASITRSHPSTVDRLDAVTKLAEEHQELLSTSDPDTRSLKRVLSHPETRRLVDSYRLAMEVLENPAAPGVLRKARIAASGITQTHAFPLFALLQVQSQGKQTGLSSLAQDTALLGANIRSAKDRAWITYQQLAERYIAQGRKSEAGMIVAQARSHFPMAFDPMLYEIRFTGEHGQGWQLAKSLALSCSRQQRSITAKQQCLAAATSPQEKAQQEAASRAKAQALSNKLFNR